MLDFSKIKTSKDDTDLIAEIAGKAAKLYADIGHDFDMMSMVMDLEVVHAETPLRLEEMLESENYDFIHDIAGIRRHLNRATGRLEDFFVPRFTR